MPTSTMKLFLSMMRNIRSNKMNRAMIGYFVKKTYPPATRSEIEPFARAVNDDNPAYYSPEALVPLFFLGKLMIPIVKDIWAHPSLKLNLLKSVQITQSVTWFSPIRQGDTVSVQGRIQDIYSTPKGEVLELSGIALVKGCVAVRGITGLLMTSANGGQEHRPQEEKPLSEQFRILVPIPDGQQLLYARASGDNNFIHTSPFLARMAGLPRTIMQGACVMAMITRALTEHLLNNDITRPASISCRFGKPVFPGETLTIIGYRSENEKEVPFVVVDPRGRSVLREGVFTIK
jgi:acyl dehydratase